MSIQYRAYLLRIWFGADQPGGPWRCALEDLRSHAVLNFQDPGSLAKYLEAQSAMIPAAVEGGQPGPDTPPVRE